MSTSHSIVVGGKLMSGQMDSETPIGKFWWLVGFYSAHHPNERKGQALFNVLAKVRPDLSEQIRGTPFDPFYKDSVIESCSLWIEQHWHE